MLQAAMLQALHSDLVNFNQPLTAS